MEIELPFSQTAPTDLFHVAPDPPPAGGSCLAGCILPCWTEGIRSKGAQGSPSLLQAAWVQLLEGLEEQSLPMTALSEHKDEVLLQDSTVCLEPVDLRDDLLGVARTIHAEQSGQE